MKIITTSFVVCLGCIIIICFDGCKKRAGATCGANEFKLSQTQLATDQHKADNGDAEAAFRVYNHYSFGMGNDETGKIWLIRAVNLGHEMAKQHLEVIDDK